MGFGGLSKSERLIIGYIEKHLTDSDGDLDEEIDQKLEELKQALQEAGLTIDDLAQNLDILMFVTYMDFDEIIEYIKKKVSAMKNKSAKLACINESHNIVQNKKQESVEQIVLLLEQNGLGDILGYSPKSRSLIYLASPEKVRENLYYLAQMNDYRYQIRSNPELLYKYSISDIKKMIEEKNRNNKENDNDVNEKEKIDEEENKEEDDNNQIQEKDISEEEINDNNNKIKKYEYLGEESEILKLQEIFKFYGISSSLLTNNPEICYRVIRCASSDRIKQFKSISSILKIFAASGIPFSVIEKYPEILARGSKGKIVAIIKELGDQGLSLNLIYACPEILLKSSPEKIYKVVAKLEDAGINKYLIYSCPQILISGNTQILIDISKNMLDKVPDMNIILDTAPYVFVQKIQDEYLKLENSDVSINKKGFKDNRDILYIKDIELVQENISLLRQKGLDLSLIKEDNKVLILGQKEKMNQIIDKIRSYEFEDEFIESNPSILYLSTVTVVEDITQTIKENRPNTFKEIISKVPDIYTKTDSKKVKEVFEIVEDLGMKYKVVDSEPNILLREDTNEIRRVVDNLTIKHNVLISDIENNPRIISEGKEKYIDRNYETFRINGLSIPFGYIYTKSARNNEKNIDTLVESGLYEYIEKTPEILDVEHAKVVQFIKIARQEDIPLVVRDGQKQKILNMEYFNSTQEEVSQEYGIDISSINKAREDIDKNPPRRVKNPELYVAVLPQFFAQAGLTLSEYENDKISYKKYEQVVSKQKVVREAYIDLERASIRKYNSTYAKALQDGLSEKEAAKVAKKEIKLLIQVPVISKQLDKTLDRLTKKIESQSNTKKITIPKRNEVSVSKEPKKMAISKVNKDKDDK